MKTCVPEIRRPWFAESHNGFEKALFIAVSNSGVVFFSDDGKQQLVLYTHTSMPRKLRFFPSGKSVGTSLVGFQSMSKVQFQSIAGLTFLRDDAILLVCDMQLKQILAVKAVRTLRGRTSDVPLSKMCFFQI